MIPIYFMGHNVIEIIGGDKSIIVQISLDEHFLNLFVS